MQPLAQGLSRVMKTFTEDVHAVNRLHKITGNPEEIILPSSQTEQSRVGISELENYRIEIKDLHFLNVLKDVNLIINEGDFLTITGPSGIGKSTLLKNILGLLKPNNGVVSIGGVETKDIKKYEPKESLFNLVSYADQRPQILMGETLRDNLLLGLEDVDDEKIYETMLKLGLYKKGIEPGIDSSDPTVVNFALDDVVDHDLSGGQKVRLGLARALLRDAKIILLDEPTASLDNGSARGVRQLLTKLHEENPGTTIICITHDENLIEDSRKIGSTISLSKKINNLDTIEGVRELILRVQPEIPEDAKKFLVEDLFTLTGIDIYDLRRVLIPHSDEAVIYSDMIWEPSSSDNRVETLPTESTEPKSI
jgi:ABC-type multidrug transport system fused ATPase/permease subunit